MATIKSIKEKAKRYDEALEAIKSFQEVNPSDEGIQNWVKDNFPELKESEDEKIRKRIISALVEWNEICSFPGDSDDMIAWLEKQGEQKPTCKVEQKSIWHNEDEEPQRGCLILLIMQSGNPIVAQIIEPNHTFNHGERWAYIDDLLEKQDEQKSAVIIPKFKVGDFVRSKYNKAVVLRIEEVCNDIYKTERGGYIRIEFQDDWELMEEKSAWSEKDKTVLDALIRRLEGDNIYVSPHLAAECLKPLKDRVQPQSTWKPSDEQIKVLVEVLIFAANHESPHWQDYIFGILKNLTRQLKKLREE